MKCCAILLFSLSLLLVSSGRGQWHSDSTTNTAVCTASGNQNDPQIISDGNNGAIVVWQDLRGSVWAIYAQHLDQNGNATWATNGVPVCRKAGSNHTLPVICTDGSGGAYVVWRDDRTPANDTDLYAQHLKSDGTLAWDTVGLGVCEKAQNQSNPSICADGLGNAFVAWEDSRATSTTTRPDIYYNELLPAGPKWFDTGKALITLGGQQKGPKICEDGTGGFFLAFQNGNTTPISIWGTRVSTAGSVLWGSQFQGISIYQGGTSTNVASDIDVKWDSVVNQFIMAFEVTNSNTSSGQDIYGQRVFNNGAGGTVWYGGTPAPIVSGFLGNQIHPQVFSDDSVINLGGTNTAGLLVPFTSLIDTPTLEVRRANPNGVDVEPTDSYFDVGPSYLGGQGEFSAVKVGTGKILVAWSDTRRGNGTGNIYCQVIDRVPERCLPSVGTFSEWGRPLRVLSSFANQVSLAPRTNGGIAAWTDSRNGNQDIYAQLVFSDGSLPIELTSFNVTATGPRVNLNWTTAQQTNNAGFDVERRIVTDQNDQPFELVQSYTSNPALRGEIQSSVPENYSAVDYPGVSGTYEYRIVDINLNGTRTEHPAQQVEVATGSGAIAWSLLQSQPNPATDRVTLSFTTGASANVDLIVTDILGRVVAEPLQHQAFAAGGHSVGFDVSKFSRGASSGTYLYKLTATDPATGALLWTNAKAMTMQVIH